jgi:hypothetical protein
MASAGMTSLKTPLDWRLPTISGFRLTCWGQTHQEQGLQFRAYVPLLMELLEDADGMVRDCAKSTVIELFK